MRPRVYFAPRTIQPLARSLPSSAAVLHVLVGVASVVAGALAATPCAARTADAIVIDIAGDGLDLSGQTKTSLLEGPPITVRWTVSGTDDCFLLLDATTARDVGYEVLEGGVTLDGMVLFRSGLILETPDAVQHAITDGWHMLSLLDSDASGRVDSLDAVWNELALWMDADADGELVDPEIHRPPPLSGVDQLGISGGAAYMDPHGNTGSDGSWWGVCAGCVASSVLFAAPPAVVFQGLTNRPEGQAQLSAAPSGPLMMGNIGPSLDDGVAIELGTSHGAAVAIGPWPLAPTTGDAAEVAFRFNLADATSSEVSVAAAHGGSWWNLGFDWSTLGVSTGSIELYRNDSLVTRADNVNLASALSADSLFSGVEAIVEEYVQLSNSSSDPNAPGLASAFVTWNDPPQVVLEGMTFTADEAHLIVDVPAALAPTTCDQVAIHAAFSTGTGAVDVTDEALRMFGHAHRGVGQAQIVAGDPDVGCTECLVVSNVGPAGADGVLTDLQPPHEIGTGAQLAASTVTDVVANNGSVVLNALGELNGMQDQVLASVAMTPVGMNLEFTPDFTPLSPGSVSLILTLQGNPVGTVSNFTGSLETTIDPTTSVGLAAINPSSDKLELDVIFGGTVTSISPAFGPCDRATISVSGLSALFRLRGATCRGTENKRYESMQDWAIADAVAQRLGLRSEGSAYVEITRPGVVGVGNLLDFDDGVSFEPLFDTNAFQLEWVESVAPPDAGDGIDFGPTVLEPSGAMVQTFARISTRFDGTSVQLFADFSEVGAPSYDLLLWNDGMATTVSAVPNGFPVGTMPVLPSGAAVLTQFDAFGSSVLRVQYKLPPDTPVTTSRAVVQGGVVPFESGPWDGEHSSVSGTTMIPTDIVEARVPLDSVVTAIREVRLLLPGMDAFVIHSLALDTTTDAEWVPRGRTFLHPVAPNPFNPRVRIRFELARGGPVELRIYDARGRLVDTLFRGKRPPGEGAFMWDGRSRSGSRAASGTYFVTLESVDGTATRKITLVR